MSTEGNYNINYDDEKFKAVESDKNAAISDIEKTYSGMINDSDDYYQAQINATKDWETKQSQLQQEQTDFAIEQIEQQKQQADKDYKKEQSGAYVDWQKQSNEYGANAEAEAMQGMSNTGYSESSQVSMYNAYQSRVSAARESFTRAVQDFDNDITNARLQNNSAMAQIAFESLQQRLELALSGFQYKNQLILDQVSQKQKIDSEYYSRWQDVLNQMNTENALAEEIRQFNYYNKLGEFAKKSSGSSGSGSGGAYLKDSSGDGTSGDGTNGGPYYGADVASDLSTASAQSEKLTQKAPTKTSKSTWEKIIEAAKKMTNSTGSYS